MSQVELQSSIPGPLPATIALVVAAILIFLSAMVMIPPYSMLLFPLAVGSSEYSPFLVLLDLVWCIAASRFLRGHGWIRGASIGALVIAAIIAIRPLTQYTRVAAAASEQLGGADAPHRFSLLTALRGLPASSDVTMRTIDYIAPDATRLQMRLYAQREPKRRPTIVVIYGGAWRNGDASQCEDVSRALASRGFAVAAIDYRHAPRVHYPAQLDDVRLSLMMLRDSADAWGLDRDRMAVLGRSAGGHLAELNSYAPGEVPMKAVVAMYAPYDLIEGYRDLPSPDPIDVRDVLRGFIGGTPDDQHRSYIAASPSSWVRKGLPPTLLIFGGRDHIIKPAFNRAAAAALRAANVPVVAVELPWAEHGFDMAPAGLGAQLAFHVIVEFLERELQHKY